MTFCLTVGPHSIFLDVMTPSQPLEKPVEIWTATGPVMLTEGTTLHNAQLPAPLDACYTEGAPDAASLGRLIRQYKLNFSWNFDDFEHPLLVDSGGNQFMVRVEADCPILSGSRTISNCPAICFAVAKAMNKNDPSTCASNVHTWPSKLPNGTAEVDDNGASGCRASDGEALGSAQAESAVGEDDAAANGCCSFL